mmetsp:Transcript_133593/g.427218  ORF Transcript_133593/g.427218 Transcript_133593/m.427218 type:complete len:225 (-) Transcript_133593:792-1466(-)
MPIRATILADPLRQPLFAGAVHNLGDLGHGLRSKDPLRQRQASEHGLSVFLAPQNVGIDSRGAGGVAGADHDGAHARGPCQADIDADHLAHGSPHRTPLDQKPDQRSHHVTHERSQKATKTSRLVHDRADDNRQQTVQCNSVQDHELHPVRLIVDEALRAMWSEILRRIEGHSALCTYSEQGVIFEAIAHRQVSNQRNAQLAEQGGRPDAGQLQKLRGVDGTSA